MGVLGCVQARATHVPVLAFDPALVLELAETERASILLGVPTMLIALTEHPDLARRDLSALRCVVSGGPTVPAELVHRIEERLGVTFSIVYGTTECCHWSPRPGSTTHSPTARARWGSRCRRPRW